MLVPAVAYKEELLKKFSKEIYSDRYFLYCGYAHGHVLPDIGDYDDTYQWAILNNDKVVGWFSYRIYRDTNSAENFGLYSFDDPDNSIMSNALSLGRDVYSKIEELIGQYHRVSWKVIEGNPVKKSYDKLCKAHNGNVVHLHDVTTDNYGRYRGQYIYEIVKSDEDDLDWRVV